MLYSVTMKKIVIGTAGHIDHGKTTLIKAITGIDCDRLKEEKERGITTELGFAHYKFGDDLMVGIVDVPGHEKFVRHMVAGAWGIDMVLLVVAADEGVMPQTKEHLDICELLGLKKGIVAVTKKDLVDEVMLELVKEDIEDTLKGRSLQGAPVIPVSSTTGENIEALRQMIVAEAAGVQDRSRGGIFRLPVDRVFTLKGLGTIITGTCISGLIRVGDEVEIYPTGKHARVRNIQSYHEDVNEAMAGQRVALNLQGLERSDVERGAIIGRPESLMLATRIDASLKYLKLPFKPIRNDSILRFHVATTQAEARLVLLEKDTIEPGEELFVQFAFAEPIVTLPEDRFVLRGPYAIQTIGGGRVLDVMPGRHKRKQAALVEMYDLLTAGNLQAKVEYHVLKGGFAGIDRATLAIVLGTDGPTLDGLVSELAQKKRLVLIGKQAVHAARFDEYISSTTKLVKDFHAKNPQKIGISKEELRSRLPKVEPVIFQAALEQCVKAGNLEAEKDKVMIRGAAGTSDSGTASAKEQISRKLKSYGFDAPSLKELSAELNLKEPYVKDVLQLLVFEGTVIKVKGDLYFQGDLISGLKEKVVAFLKEKKEMSTSDFRTILPVSRKYMIPLLEYFDEMKVTIRKGDVRVLRS
jgi:selenocysteine-specific elongation factor